MVSVIVKLHRTVFRGRRGEGLIRFEVQKVNGFTVVAVNWLTELTSRRFRVTVIEHALDRIPTSSQQDVLLHFFLSRSDYPAPVDQTRSEFLLFVLVLGVFFERLHSGAIFNVEAVNSTALVSNKKLTISVVHTHAGNVLRSSVSEHGL